FRPPLDFLKDFFDRLRAARICCPQFVDILYNYRLPSAKEVGGKEQQPQCGGWGREGDNFGV
ncbi:MAG: hypothetical protein ACI3YH_07505, partial [Eubacteriales bacterium]